jgi:hypothetical protein
MVIYVLSIDNMDMYINMYIIYICMAPPQKIETSHPIKSWHINRATPLNNIRVSWDDYSQNMEK